MKVNRGVESSKASALQLREELATHPVHDIPPAGSVYAFGRVHRDRVSLIGYRNEIKKRLRAAAYRMFGIHGADRRFIVFARPRSGTTLLVDLLNQVDGLRCDGELLHFSVINPTRFLSALARTCAQPTYGCKILSYQMFEIQRIADHLGFLESLRKDGYHLIHLRRNTFPQCLSLAKAQKVGLFTDWANRPTGDRKLPPTINLDTEKFEHQIRWNAAMLDYEDLLMSCVPHSVFQYEDDLCTPEAQQSTVNEICDLIGHPTGPVFARTKKISGKDAETKIANQDELRAIAERLGAA